MVESGQREREPVRAATFSKCMAEVQKGLTNTRQDRVQESLAEEQPVVETSTGSTQFSRRHPHPPNPGDEAFAMNGIGTYGYGTYGVFSRVRNVVSGMVVCGSLLVAGWSVCAQSVQFEDVTVNAGVSYLHWDGTLAPEISGPELELAYMTGGAAAGDFDGINGPDLYATRMGAPNLLFRNTGNANFDEVGDDAGVAVSGLSSGCAWGDVDNDGDLDLYVVTFDPGGQNHLFMNDGMGSFTDEAVARGVDMPSAGFRLLTSAAFGDYNLDGALDLFVTEWISGFSDQNKLFRNDGTGHFEDVTQQAGVFVGQFSGFAPGFADMDNDGWPEILVAADFGTSQLFKNLQNGTFDNITLSARVGTDENGMGSTIGDCDGDGFPDWFVTSIYDPANTCQIVACSWGTTGNRMFLNRLDSVSRFLDFTSTAGVRDGGWGWGTSFLDVENDGDLDLAMTNGVAFPFSEADDHFNNDPVKLWENDGTGNFTEVSVESQFVDDGSGKGFVVFDYDRDGNQDIFVVNNASQPVLFRNNGGNTNDWLRVSLRGHTTNTWGVGARVTVQATADGPVQVQDMFANSNFMSQNETVVHFGFGSDVTTLHSVRVTWPASGFEQELADISTNQLLVIEEPRRVYIRGDANDDGRVNLADPLRILNTLFGSQSMDCNDAAEVNGSGNIDLSDAIYLLNGLFASAALPLPPYPNCGVNPDGRDQCRRYVSCSS